MFSEHATTFAGKPVVDFELDGTLENAAGSVPALRCDYDSEHTAVDLLSRLLEQPVVDQIKGLVIGAWVGEEIYEEDPGPVVETLVAAAGQLPNLTALFIGDMTYEENEVSWIHQTDLSPLLTTFDRLETLQVRGAEGLRLGESLQHDHLKTLIIECGGLPVAVLRDIQSASLPALEHLELYLGTTYYGGDATVGDLEKLLSGELFPKLRYLGLRDSEIADDIAPAAARAPIVERIEVLDLSLGTLSDEGAQALLDSPAIARLQKLDLHRHYCSEEMMARLSALPPDVDVSDRQEGEGDDRYVAVSE